MCDTTFQNGYEYIIPFSCLKVIAFYENMLYISNPNSLDSLLLAIIVEFLKISHSNNEVI